MEMIIIFREYRPRRATLSFFSPEQLRESTLERMQRSVVSPVAELTSEVHTPERVEFGAHTKKKVILERNWGKLFVFRKELSIRRTFLVFPPDPRVKKTKRSQLPLRERLMRRWRRRMTVSPTERVLKNTRLKSWKLPYSKSPTKTRINLSLKSR